MKKAPIESSTASEHFENKQPHRLIQAVLLPWLAVVMAQAALAAGQPDPEPTGLVNLKTIPHAALEHQLRPGSRLEFVVDATNRLRSATAEAGGVAFHRVQGSLYDQHGNYRLKPELEAAIRELRLPMTRFYGIGDEPFDVEAAIDRIADVCRRAGVPQDHCVLELEEQSASTQLPPETWARAAAYVLKKGYQFRHWEIVNEPYSCLWGYGKAFPTREDFIAHFKAVSTALRRVDPNVQIGLNAHAEHPLWGNSLLKQLAGYYDFVSPHYYCFADLHKLSFEDIALTENFRMLDKILRNQALLRAYNGDRSVYLYDTEWGMHCKASDGRSPDYEPRNANITGIMHRAVRMIYYARQGMVRGAGGWQLLSAARTPGFGIICREGPDPHFMMYWLYYYFNRHVGEWVLQVDGTAPYWTPAKGSEPFTGPLTPTLATLSREGRELYLVMANASWTQAMPCHVGLQHFQATEAKGVVLTSNDLDASPLLKDKQEVVSDFPVSTTAESLTCTLPAHSIVFITLTRK